MQRAMAKQAEAEREKRAKVITAEGEFQASQTLANAAEVIQRQPAAIALRYMQTLVEIGYEKNTTIVFPVPVELIRPMLQVAETLTAPPADQKASKSSPPPKSPPSSPPSPQPSSPTSERSEPESPSEREVAKVDTRLLTFAEPQS